MKKEVLMFSALSALLFISFAVGGYFYALVNPEVASSALDKAIEELGFLFNLEPFWLFVFIFINNSIKTLIFMLLGVFGGVFPIIFIAMNGYFLGAVVSILEREIGITSVILGILPHGIFEIPAAIIASGYGMFIGWSVLSGKRKEIIPLIKEAFYFYLKFILPTLFIASLIEVFIVPYII